MDAKIVIIGAGVVGLAIAAELSRYHQNIIVLERHDSFGQDQSSRNSEVIHAGLYYPENSLKAKLCVEGNNLLYNWCMRYKIEYENCEKLIVATTPDEIDQLYNIYIQGNLNGLKSLEMISQSTIKLLEPNIFGLEAILSKSTGIINSHEYMQSLEAYALNRKVIISYHSDVVGIHQIPGGYEILVSNSSDFYTITAEIVINSAGLYADQIAKFVGIDVVNNKYEIQFARGHYFKLSSKYQNFTHRLIYPVPEKNWSGIGIHITKDLEGYMKLGPDIQYLKYNVEDYEIPKNKINQFYSAAKKYIPNLQKSELTPDLAGIRAKLQKKGEPFRDFVIQNEADKGCDGFINLIGIESPGLTSSLAIAKYVKKIIDNL